MHVCLTCYKVNMLQSYSSYSSAFGIGCLGGGMNHCFFIVAPIVVWLCAGAAEIYVEKAR